MGGDRHALFLHIIIIIVLHHRQAAPTMPPSHLPSACEVSSRRVVSWGAAGIRSSGSRGAVSTCSCTTMRPSLSTSRSSPTHSPTTVSRHSYRWGLGCILLKMPATSLLTGTARNGWRFSYVQVTRSTVAPIRAPLSSDLVDRRRTGRRFRSMTARCTPSARGSGRSCSSRRLRGTACSTAGPSSSSAVSPPRSLLASGLHSSKSASNDRANRRAARSVLSSPWPKI